MIPSGQGSQAMGDIITLELGPSLKSKGILTPSIYIYICSYVDFLYMYIHIKRPNCTYYIAVFGTWTMLFIIIEAPV